MPSILVGRKRRTCGLWAHDGTCVAMQAKRDGTRPEAPACKLQISACASARVGSAARHSPHAALLMACAPELRVDVTIAAAAGADLGIVFHRGGILAHGGVESGVWVGAA